MGLFLEEGIRVRCVDAYFKIWRKSPFDLDCNKQCGKSNGSIRVRKFTPIWSDFIRLLKISLKKFCKIKKTGSFRTLESLVRVGGQIRKSFKRVKLKNVSQASFAVSKKSEFNPIEHIFCWSKLFTLTFCHNGEIIWSNGSVEDKLSDRVI